jgi:Mrp family chromosome partitioning ATPase
MVSSEISQVDMDGEMVQLHHQLNALLPGNDHRIVQFIASHESEGTSTITHALAKVSAVRFGQRVLLLEMNQRDTNQQHRGVGTGSSRVELVCSQCDHTTLYVARMPSHLAEGWREPNSTGSRETWSELRNEYDLIIVDSLSASTSPEALTISNQVDGVVLVLEAESTRWPVVQSIKERVERSNGRVLGIVFNKRREYIPQFVYNRL